MFGFRRANTTPSPVGEFRCSFCNKSQRYVQKLIAGPNQVHICNECVDICLGILNPPADESLPLIAAVHACSLCDIPVAATESLSIGARGVLCPGCVGEIQASLEERN